MSFVSDKEALAELHCLQCPPDDAGQTPVLRPYGWNPSGTRRYLCPNCQTVRTEAGRGVGVPTIFAAPLSKMQRFNRVKLRKVWTQSGTFGRLIIDRMLELGSEKKTLVDLIGIPIHKGDKWLRGQLPSDPDQILAVAKWLSIPEEDLKAAAVADSDRTELESMVGTLDGFGELLLGEILMRGLYVPDLAQALGVDCDLVPRYLKGELDIDKKTVRAIARQFRIDIDQLINLWEDRRS